MPPKMKVQWKIAARFSNTKRVVAHMHRDDQSALNRWSNLRVMHGVIGDGKSFIFDDWDRFWGFVAASGVEVSEIKPFMEKIEELETLLRKYPGPNTVEYLIHDATGMLRVVIKNKFEVDVKENLINELGELDYIDRLSLNVK